MGDDHAPRRRTGRRALLTAGVSGLAVAAGCGRIPGSGTTPPPQTATSSSPTPPRSTTNHSTPTGSTTSDSAPSSSTSSSPPRAQLPRGGRRIFPRYRVVAYYGTAGGGALGVLGSQPPAAIAARIEKTAARFASPGRTVQPAMELIVTIADRSPGAGGAYHHSISPDRAREYLRAARKHRMLLVLDLQPGHTRFPPLARQWESLLAEPDVGLALDAEWRMPRGRIPGRVIGHTTAAEVNETTRWLAGLVRRHHLPEKLVVLHQFTHSMIRDIDKIKKRPGLALVQHVDGFGKPADKIARYDDLQRPKQFHLGFKLFYQEDTGLMSPSRVLKLKPAPDYISYQ